MGKRATVCAVWCAIVPYHLTCTYMYVCTYVCLSVFSCYSTSLLGGAYIPPARLRMVQQQITDKNRYSMTYMGHVILFITEPHICSEPYQRLAWEALKKSINGLVNKVTMVIHVHSE